MQGDLAVIKEHQREVEVEAESKKEDQGQVDDVVIRPTCQPLEIVQKESRKQHYTIYWTLNPNYKAKYW